MEIVINTGTVRTLHSICIIIVTDQTRKGAHLIGRFLNLLWPAREQVFNKGSLWIPKSLIERKVMQGNAQNKQW